MIKLENGLERVKIVCLSVWEDVEVWQGQLKLKKGLLRKTSCYSGMANLNESVRYVGTHNDPCNLARKIIQGHQGKLGHNDLHSS